MNSFTVYLVRHGATVLNAYDRMQGWIDSDLSQDGVDQSQEAAKKLKDITFDRAFSSDLGRAMKTRNIIIGHTPVQEITELNQFREVNFGFFEGLKAEDIWHGIAAPYGKSTQADLIEIGGLAEARNAMKNADPSNVAENYEEVINRMKAGFQALRDRCQPNENVLLVSHGTFIRTMADYLGVDTKDNYPKNGGISQITVYDDQVVFESYNQ